MTGAPLTLAVCAGAFAIVTAACWWRQLTAHVRTWHAVRSADPIVRRRHALDALDRIHQKASR